MTRFVGLLLACLFLVTPSVDAWCRASCSPAPAGAPSCHERVATPDRALLTSAASCQPELVIAVPTADWRRASVVPDAATAAHARLLPNDDASTRPALHGVAAMPPSPRCPRCPVLRI